MTSKTTNTLNEDSDLPASAQSELEMMFMKHYAPNSYLSLKIPKFTNISLSNKIAM